MRNSSRAVTLESEGERRGRKVVSGRATRGVWSNSEAKTFREVLAKVESAVREGKKRKSGKRGKWSILCGEDMIVGKPDPRWVPSWWMCGVELARCSEEIYNQVILWASECGFLIFPFKSLFVNLTEDF